MQKKETHCAIVGFPTKQEFREKAWHIVNIIADLTGFKLWVFERYAKKFH
jgi:hypothetical protein